MTPRAYKYRLYPTPEQAVLLAKTFGCVRVIWNEYTAAFNAYKGEEKPVYPTTTELRKRADREWMKEVSAAALQQKARDFDEFTRQFFDKKRAKKVGRPKFKNKFNRQSYRLPNQKFDLLTHSIRLEKVGKVKAKIDRRPNKLGRPLSVTVSKEPCGHYYASVLVEEPAVAVYPKTSQSVGIDLGLTHFLTLSTGEKIDNPRHFRKNQAKLAKAQKNLSRKKKGSRRRIKAKLKVAKMHAKMRHQRDWFHQQVSNKLLKEFDFIGMETLCVSNMMKNRKLAKSIGDAGWSRFNSILEYKSVREGKKVSRIGTFEASTKECSDCGAQTKLKLSDREWKCGCGAVHDRDINAAKVILTKARISASQEADKPKGVTLGIRTQRRCKTGLPAVSDGASREVSGSV